MKLMMCYLQKMPSAEVVAVDLRCPGAYDTGFPSRAHKPCPPRLFPRGLHATLLPASLLRNSVRVLYLEHVTPKFLCRLMTMNCIT